MGNPCETELDRNQANCQPLMPITYLERAAAVCPDHVAIIHGVTQLCGAPIASVEMKPGANVSEAELPADCRSLPARFKCPKLIVFAEIPKTSTGNIQKYRLRDRPRGLVEADAA